MTYNKSQVFSNLSDEYLQKSSGPSTQIMPEEGKPISQQSFSMTPNKTDLEMPTVDIQPTYVPGVGVLGADIEGVTKGLQARQAYRLAEEKNIRDNETLGIAKAKLGQDQDYLKMAEANLGIKLDEASQTRKTFDDEQALNDGMVMAAKSGGYAGVIDYLKEADPTKALVFEAAKLKIDNDIMSNDVLKAQLPAAKQEALLQTYGVMGKMAAGIMSAPPEKQAEMYEQSLPITNKLIPNMPKKFNSQAQAILTLMTAQGSPQNIATQNQNLANYAKTEIGQLELARKEAANKYGISSKEVQEIDAQKETLNQKASLSSLRAEQIKAQTNQQQQGADNAGARISLSYNQALKNDSAEFTKKANSLAMMKSSMDLILADKAAGKPINNAALTNLSYAIAKANNGAGILTEPDYQNNKASAGFATWSKQMQAFMTGGKIEMAPWEVDQALVLAQASYKKNLDLQKQREQVWVDGGKDPETGKPFAINWVLPSKIYESQFQQQGQQSQQPKMTKEQIDSMAQDAIQKGKPQQAVDQLRTQLYQQNGIQ